MASTGNWNAVSEKATIARSIAALKENGIDAELVSSAIEAKARVLEIIPSGAEVMTMSSRTLEETGIADAINGSGKYDSVKNKLNAMDRAKHNREMQRMGAAPEWTVSSAHAVTEDGHILIASMTGSQMAGEAGGSDHVIYVVGANKLVKNIDEGMKRIKEHVLPLESERVKVAYGLPGSKMNKVLIVNGEKLAWPSPVRSQVIFVNQKLGF
jgi:LUD domain